MSPAPLPTRPRPARRGRRPVARLAAWGAGALAAGAAAVGAARPAVERAASPAAPRVYGAPVAVGNGQARAYVVRDPQAGGAAVEVGIALDEGALDGLPAPTPAPAAAPAPAPPSGGAADAGPHAHRPAGEFSLTLPADHGTPYRFVQLNWNPAGHAPPGVYDVPHFDVHFFLITPAQRDAIDPAVQGAEAYAAKANRRPPADEGYAHYTVAGPPGAPLHAVPRMGVHWGDARSPELQALAGRPGDARPFTTTFLHGSWDGAFVFDEPMVTRAFLLARKAAAAAAERDSVMPLPAAPAYRPAGRYPAAYRVAYDADAREYHIALTRLTARLTARR